MMKPAGGGVCANDDAPRDAGTVSKIIASVTRENERVIMEHLPRLAVLASIVPLRDQLVLVGVNPLNANKTEERFRKHAGVCDNQFATARKLLILKRRDGRVV
jgi:hypothetical protein